MRREVLVFAQETPAYVQTIVAHSVADADAESQCVKCGARIRDGPANVISIRHGHHSMAWRLATSRRAPRTTIQDFR